MRFAIIESGVVVNIAIAGGPLAPNWICIDGLDVGIGWSWDGSNFIPPAIPQSA